MNHKPEILSRVIFRVPKFPLNACLKDCWEDLKAAIKLSSPEFFELIAQVSAAEIEGLPPKVKHTVDKYFNRARYRPVPFGHFAAIGIIDPRPGEDHNGIVIGKERTLHQYVDWPVKDQLSYSFDDVMEGNACLFANSSYYKVGEKLRYIFREGSTFELADIFSLPEIEEILSICSVPVAFNEVVALMDARMPEGKLPELIEEMILLQLLFTSFDPNLVGEDYFKRRGVDSEGLPTYDLLEQPYRYGRLPVPMQRSITATVRRLYDLIPSAPTNPDLQEFIRRFERRFDRREVPLMTALDPELGIGYGNFEQAGATSELVSHLADIRSQGTSGETLQHQLREIVASAVFTGKPGTVDLSEMLPASRKDRLPLPNTFSALVTCCDGLVKLEYTGGPSGTMLAGRFTMASEGVAAFTRDVAAWEQEANPDVLFFDIAYQAEVNADNVNRRKSIYDAQLSILNYDTSGCPLALNDITIRVAGGEIQLWSQRLGKRLVSRMASAYNHTRSDLSVFRLLSDLQYQGLHTSLDLDLEAILPGLASYPRVQDGSVVVAGAKWKVDLADLYGTKGERDPAILRRHLLERGASGFLKHGPADLKLCFNTDSDDDLAMMLTHWKNEKTVYVEEAFIPSQSIVTDEAGQPYYCQFLLTMGHSGSIYDGSRSGILREQTPAFFAPGSRWLYWEIYGHTSGADSLLLGEVELLLEENKDKIKKWFFIRYDEGGNHLRLRVLVDHPAGAPALIIRMQQLLQSKLGKGIVSDLQIRTYHREMERYGETSIELAESHFHLDSRYVLELLRNGLSDNDKYSLTIDFVHRIRESNVISPGEMSSVFKVMHKNLFSEHRGTTVETKMLNRKYEEFKEHSLPDLEAEADSLRSEVIHTFTMLLLGKSGEARSRLLADLLHMHLNRLFCDHQRTHELIFYHFLLKEWQRYLALNADETGSKISVGPKDGIHLSAS